MNALEQLLWSFERDDLEEITLTSDTPAHGLIDGVVEALGEEVWAADTLVGALVTFGGSRHVEELSQTPRQWTARVVGLGVISVSATQRGEEVQARFRMSKKEEKAGSPAAEPRPPQKAPDPAEPAQASPNGPPPFVPVRPTQQLRAPGPSRAGRTFASTPRRASASARRTPAFRAWSSTTRRTTRRSPPGPPYRSSSMGLTSSSTFRRLRRSWRLRIFRRCRRSPRRVPLPERHRSRCRRRRHRRPPPLRAQPFPRHRRLRRHHRHHRHRLRRHLRPLPQLRRAPRLLVAVVLPSQRRDRPRSRSALCWRMPARLARAISTSSRGARRFTASRASFV